MKRTITLLAVIGLTMGLMIPAANAGATVAKGTFEATVENDWGQKCLDNQVVTITTRVLYDYHLVVDENTNFDHVHSNLHGTLIEGSDSLGWVVTKYRVNQVNDSWNWGFGQHNLYNLHMTVADPDPDTNRAYTANFTVLLKRDWPEPSFELVNNGQGECIAWNS